MTFLLLNQTFHPDVAATGQYLAEVARGLVEHGHDVTVVTSRRAYDDPARRFAPTETWHGIRILRVGSTGFGKSARWRRALDFASFLLLCSCRLAFVSRPDVVVALTSPPLISFLGAWLALLRRARFCYWVMDFNPDEAIAAGWLRPGSFLARMLERMSRFSLLQADCVIALDRFMRDRILAKGVAPQKVTVLPPWSHDTDVKFDPAGRERFRRAHGLDSKFVVMYSGNHSPCHSLDTLLGAAANLASDPRVAFCFVGGGSEWRKINEYSVISDRYSEDRGQKSEIKSQKPEDGNQKSEVRGQRTGASSNVVCLRYQPLDRLSASLSAADLHVVVMGEPFVGLVHPCKIYNLLNLGIPVLYIGPTVSHVAEVAASVDGQLTSFSVRHGDVEGVLNAIARARQLSSPVRRNRSNHHLASYSKDILLPQLLDELEGPVAADVRRQAKSPRQLQPPYVGSYRKRW